MWSAHLHYCGQQWWHALFLSGCHCTSGGDRWHAKLYSPCAVDMVGDMALACYCHHGWHGKGLSWRTWHAMAVLVLLLSLGHVRWWSMCRPKFHLTHSGHSWYQVVVANSDNGDGDNGGGRRRVVVFVFGYGLDSSNQHGHMVLEFQWTWTNCLKLFTWLGVAAMDAWFNHICKAQ